MAITYSKLTKGPGLNVKLDGRKVGEIVPVSEGWRLLGWRYEPKAASGAKYAGETFPTVEAVKRSIEGADAETVTCILADDEGTFTQGEPTAL